VALLLALLAAPSLAFAQNPPAPETPTETPPPPAPAIDDKPKPDAPIEWAFYDATGLLKQDPKVSIIEPANDWQVRFKDGSTAKIRPSAIVLATGASDPNSLNAFDRLRTQVKWPSEGGTGSIRRYNLDAAIATFKKYLGADAAVKGARLKFNRTDRGPVEARKELERPCEEIEILRFPQTWENIWLSQVVDGVAVTERLARVKAFDEAFRIRIENKAFKPEYFSIEEKAAYASFYQSQFAAIRDKTPADPEIYDELAKYHGKRDNVDAQLSVYLDAIQNEVPDADRQYFHFLAGELLAKRLGMHADALPHLTSAYAFAEARLLIVECHHRLGEYAEAQTAADDLVALIEADKVAAAAGNEIQLSYAEDDPAYRESVRYRAMLLKARALHVQNRFGEARAQISELILAVPEGATVNPQGASPAQVQEILARAPSLHDEAKLLLASMYVFRVRAFDPNTGNTFDLLKMAADELSKNQKWGTYLREAVKDKPDLSMLPYDPLGCQAVCLWVEATTPTTGATIPADKLRALNYAATLDPLSSEPFLVRGKLAERAGQSTVVGIGANAAFNLYEARVAYEAGLAAVPQDARLNYQLGSLFQREGDLVAAERYLMAALDNAPDYYPAMNRMAEIKLAYAGGAEARLLALFAQAPSADTTREISEAAGLILRGLREAAGYFSSSLEVLPRQHAVRSNLGALYARLAGYYDNKALTGIFNPDLAKSYLQTALRHSSDVVAVIRARTEAAATSGASARPAMFEEIPPVGAYTVMASAAYQLGIRTTPQNKTLVEEAIRALEDHHIASLDPASFVDSAALTAYQNSASAAWARNALRDLKARQRQKQRVEDFEGLKFDSIAQLGNGWSVLKPDNADEGTLSVIKTGDGKLTIGTDKQVEEGFVTRVSREESFSSLRSFTATIAPLGRSGAARGIHMTKAQIAEEGGATLIWSFLLGFDNENRLFWDVRQIDATNGSEKSVLPEGRRVYIDASELGLRGQTAFPADVPLTLTIEREVPDENGGTVYYYARLGGLEGFRVLLDLSRITNIDIRNLYDSSSDLNPEVKDMALRIGFFVQAPRGGTGKMEVTDCLWVVDSNLANIVETEE